MKCKDLRFQIIYSWLNFVEGFIGLVTLGFYYPDWTGKYVTKEALRRKG
jgi:hypothetical protein